MHIFKKGELVNWNKDKTGSGMLKEITIGEYGAGPFRIRLVEEVPDKCGCGAPMTDEEHVGTTTCPFYGEPYHSVRKGVGHPQWVGLECPNTGEPVGKKFSGALLEAA